MSPAPFFDQETGRLDTRQVLAEAIPLARLVGLVVIVALVPLAVVFLLGPTTGFLGGLFVVVAQFVLAVGFGIILLYVVARAIQLADEE